jgi:hypothetical protein
LTERCGGCHCGNLALNLSLLQEPEDAPLRACGCSFCRAHYTRTTSDPDGLVEIWAEDWSLVEPYRFDRHRVEDRSRRGKRVRS